MITIAGKELTTTTPTDLDEQLVASTGCSSAEIATILGAGPDRVARALRPFLDSKVLPGSDLARAIVQDPEAVGAIAKLYAELPDPVAVSAEDVA